MGDLDKRMPSPAEVDALVAAVVTDEPVEDNSRLVDISTDPLDDKPRRHRAFYTDPAFLIPLVIFGAALALWGRQQLRAATRPAPREGEIRPCPCCATLMMFHDGHWVPAEPKSSGGDDLGDQSVGGDDSDRVSLSVDPQAFVVAEPANGRVDHVEVDVPG